MKKVIGYVLGVGVSDTFYVLVPDDLGVELEDLKHVGGKVVDLGKEYVIVGYNSSG